MSLVSAQVLELIAEEERWISQLLRCAMAAAAKSWEDEAARRDTRAVRVTCI